MFQLLQSPAFLRYLLYFKMSGFVLIVHDQIIQSADQA